jgi:hypothetical protein
MSQRIYTILGQMLNTYQVVGNFEYIQSGRWDLDHTLYAKECFQRFGVGGVFLYESSEVLSFYGFTQN